MKTVIIYASVHHNNTKELVCAIAAENDIDVVEEWKVLLIITVSGLIYNFGLLLGPWFEGKLTGCLIDILSQNAVYKDMLILVIAYVISIGVVQVSRYIKRFYVRRFAN